MDALKKNRLKWKCRRGLLELELILERYVEKHPEDHQLLELLDLPDNDLLEIALGRSEHYSPHLRQTVARLRAA